MTHDEQAPEDQAGEYLRANPDYEMSLWREWVVVVCGHRKLDPPTRREWDALGSKWHHDKMPITSADELESMRKTPSIEAAK